MQQPDIEIYLKDAAPEQVQQWLQTQFTRCTPWQNRGKLLGCTCDGITVTWFAKAVGSWHCLLFDSDRTPWRTDLDCARAAHQALAVEIRCAPGSWQEEQGEAGADDWLKVDAAGVTPIVWRTS